MNKERLILLIALSILLVIIIPITVLATPGKMVEAPKEEEIVVEEEAVDVIADGAIQAVEAAIQAIEPIEPPPASQYIIAQEVWNEMKELGWSDELCAAILGNMMAECGGNTLWLDPYAGGDGNTSFGLCQWHNGRKYNLINNYGRTIEAQIQYLAKELQEYPEILYSTKSYKEIAYDFCVLFERPSNKHNKGVYRQTLAEIAYQEFAI